MQSDLVLNTPVKQCQGQKLQLMYKVVHSLVGVTWEELVPGEATTWTLHSHKLRHYKPTATEYQHAPSFQSGMI